VGGLWEEKREDADGKERDRWLVRVGDGADHITEHSSTIPSMLTASLTTTPLSTKPLPTRSLNPAVKYLLASFPPFWLHPLLPFLHNFGCPTLHLSAPPNRLVREPSAN